jgi:tetratricopeptide (TPR) repeat protein
VARIAAIAVVGMALIGLLAQQPSAADDMALGHAATDHLAWSSALGWFAQAAALDPSSPDPWASIAQIRLWQGKLADAASAIAHATRLAPEQASLWWLAEQIGRASGADDAALHDGRRALALAPAISLAEPIASDLAAIDLSHADAAGALDDLARCRCDSTETAHLAAAAWMNLGDPIRATESGAAPDDPFVALAERWQGDAADEAALGLADSSAGWPVLALAPLRAAIQASPQYGAGHAYLAWALWQMGDFDAARPEIARALALAPDNVATATIAALALARDGQPRAAIADLLSWRQRYGAQPALLAVLAPLAESDGDDATAEDAWWQLTQIVRPVDRPQALLELAQFYVETGLGRDNGRAAWAVSAARLANPRSALACALAAQFDDQLGRDDLAQSDLQLAESLAPRDPLPHAIMAALEWRWGDRTSASIERQRALDLGASGDAQQWLSQVGDAG